MIGGVYYYRRSLELRAGAPQHVVYAVRAVEGEKPDPVPVLAGFPENWRPTENPGQCLFVLGATAAVLETHVPRSQFRVCTKIDEAEACALFPRLAERG